MHETILDPLEVPTLKPNHIRQTTFPGSPINIIGRTYVTTLKNISISTLMKFENIHTNELPEIMGKC